MTSSGFDPAGLGIGNGGPGRARWPDQICDPNANAPKVYGSSAQNMSWFNTACFAPGSAGCGSSG